MAAPTVEICKGCNKTILKEGDGDIPKYLDGTKVTFQFRTEQPDGKVVDDTRVGMSRPMELVFGKKFKLEVWEECVRSMRVDEVATFHVDKALVLTYPWVSKTIRDAFGTKKKKGHQDCSSMTPTCCSVNVFVEHPDLGLLVQQPTDMIFTFEIVRVEEPGEYVKEAWQMGEREKMESVPELREEGNRLYRDEGKYADAADRYAKAIGLLEQLQLKEKPGEEEWDSLERTKRPLLLNYSQCKLQLGEFYVAIENTSTVLKTDPDNVKALFRRGRAHVGAWNPEEARADLERAATLDPSLRGSVNKLLAELDAAVKQKDAIDAQKLAKMFK